MYQSTQPAGIGFSLKPPAWLRTAVGNIVSGKAGTIPLPSGGNVVVNPSPVPTPVQQFERNVEQNIPGGWGTIAMVGIGALALVLLLKRR